MHIWLIQTGEPLPLDDSVKKMRTAILADKLFEKGHSVTWWTSAFDHIKKEWIFTDDTETKLQSGIKVIALKGTGYKKNISLRRFMDHRSVAEKFYNMACQMPKPDFIVASLPPHNLAYRAVVYAKKNNLPVLTDIRDPWPDIFLEHLPSAIRSLAKMILFNEFRMAKRALGKASGLISVTEGLMKWGMDYAGREMNRNDKVFPIGYKKPKEINMSGVNPAFIKLHEKLRYKFIVFFVGTLSKSYHNPSILIKAAAMIKENKDIHFLIAGDGELFQELKFMTDDKPNITLTGWLNQSEIEFWLKHSKIGVCPATKPVDLPTNKAFAYFSSGLPVITSFQGELREIIEKNNIGMYYPANDTRELVNCILKLYENRPLFELMSDNSAKLFNEMFDAEKIYSDYADHIEMIYKKFKSK